MKNERKIGDLNPEQKRIVNKIVEKEVVVKKKGILEKVVDSFIPEDIKSVREHLIFDIILPKSKDLLFDTFETMIYGTSGRRNVRSSGGTKISYNKHYDRETHNRPLYGRMSNFEDSIIFESRFDAESVLDEMYDILEKYNEVSVNDLYELAGVRNDNYNYSKYGWDSLTGSRVVVVRGGYSLKLPRPKNIDY